MQEGLAQNPIPPTGLQVELVLPLRTLTVTATGAGKGTIVTEPSGSTFPQGTVVMLTANPDSQSKLSGWSGACAGSGRSCSVTMNSDLTVTADFQRKSPFPEPSKPQYVNPYQGLFQCHDVHYAGLDYLAGGGIIVSWGFLQKDSPDRLHQGNLNRFIEELRRIRSMGKKVYLHIMMYGHQGPEELAPFARPVFPEWVNVNYANPQGVLNDNKIRGIDGGGPSMYPSPWDPEYKAKLEVFLRLLNQALQDSDVADVIEYIEPSVGGRWAAPELWVSEQVLSGWLSAAGCPAKDWNCLGREFTKAVNAIVDTYMRSLPDYPLMFVGGACKSPDPKQSCNYTGFGEIRRNYGMRFFYKKAGLGHINMESCGLADGEFSGICGGTRCGQEPWGSSCDCMGKTGYGFAKSDAGCNINTSGYWGVYEAIYDYSLKREGLSYYCIYSSEFNCSRKPEVAAVNHMVADRLGAQISLTGHNLPGPIVNVNAPVSFQISWKNTGATAPIAPLKSGLKWSPASYKLFLEWVKDGRVVHYEELELTPPTPEWTPRANSTPRSLNVVDITTPIRFTVPQVLGGDLESSLHTYKLYTGLVDPNGDNRRFAFVNGDSNNDKANRRYLLNGSFTVRGKKAP